MPKGVRATERVRGQARRDGNTDVTIPQKGPGNRKWDQEWLKREEAAGRIEPVDDDDGVPFGCRKKWTGRLEDIGSEWQIPNLAGRCNGTSFIRDEEGRRIAGPDGQLLTRPCQRWPIKGGKVCLKHGGSMEGVHNAAITRMAGAVDMVTGRLIMLATADGIDPNAQVKAINSLLDRAGLRAGATVSIEVPGWQTLLRDLFEGPKDSE